MKDYIIDPAGIAALQAALPAAQADVDRTTDLVTKMAKQGIIDIIKRSCEAGKVDELDYAMLDVACMMFNGKSLKGGRKVAKPKAPKQIKYRRGIGSY